MASSSFSPYPAPADMKALIDASRSLLDQPPPPTLRDILTAYKTKGDGDRDMLLAMLNAKSAEDQVRTFLLFVCFHGSHFSTQRIASSAALHRQMLEISISQQQASPTMQHQHPHIHPLHLPPPIPYPYHELHPAPFRSPPPPSEDYSRKRRRTTPTSVAYPHSKSYHGSTAYPQQPHHLPPSPRSESSTSHNVIQAQGGRMSIDTLLSSASASEAEHEHDQGCDDMDAGDSEERRSVRSNVSAERLSPREDTQGR